MKRFLLLAINVLFQIYAFAQKGKVRPEWDLMDDGEEVLNSPVDSLGGILFLIVVFIIILFYFWLKESIDRKASKKVYIAKKKIDAYHSVNDFYKEERNNFHTIGHYEYVETEDIEKGTKCTEVKKVDENICWAKFEGRHSPLIVRRDDIKKL